MSDTIASLRWKMSSDDLPFVVNTRNAFAAPSDEKPIDKALNDC